MLMCGPPGPFRDHSDWPGVTQDPVCMIFAMIWAIIIGCLIIQWLK